jgi:hypothetical protein
MQIIGPLRKEFRGRTSERCSRMELNYDDGRKTTDAAAARGQSLPLPRSGLVQPPLSNALKCIWVAPLVVNGAHSELVEVDERFGLKMGLPSPFTGTWDSKLRDLRTRHFLQTLLFERGS